MVNGGSKDPPFRRASWPGEDPAICWARGGLRAAPSSYAISKWIRNDRFTTSQLRMDPVAGKLPRVFRPGRDRQQWISAASASGTFATSSISPALRDAGGDDLTQIREEVTTRGRVIVRGKLVSRGQAKRADYILYFKPNTRWR